MIEANRALRIVPAVLSGLVTAGLALAVHTTTPVRHALAEAAPGRMTHTGLQTPFLLFQVATGTGVIRRTPTEPPRATQPPTTATAAPRTPPPGTTAIPSATVGGAIAPPTITPLAGGTADSSAMESSPPPGAATTQSPAPRPEPAEGVTAPLEPPADRMTGTHSLATASAPTSLQPPAAGQIATRDEDRPTPSILTRLADDKPGIWGNSLLYVVLAAVYAVLLGLFLRLVFALLRDAN
jgi:hypothetical protein